MQRELPWHLQGAMQTRGRDTREMRRRRRLQRGVHGNLHRAQVRDRAYAPCLQKGHQLPIELQRTSIGVGSLLPAIGDAFLQRRRHGRLTKLKATLEANLPKLIAAAKARKRTARGAGAREGVGYGPSGGGERQ